LYNLYNSIIIDFQYLTGNTNNETLVKVISAVLKFSPQQAQVALEKEHQRRSLVWQLKCFIKQYKLIKFFVLFAAN